MAGFADEPTPTLAAPSARLHVVAPGALGFLIAAVLLLPERTRDESTARGEGPTVRA
jgi:hypothetical protein